MTLACVVGLLLWAGPAVTAHAAPARGTDGVPEELHQKIGEGIRDIFLMEFDRSEEIFTQALEKHPGTPYGFWGRAMTAWARFEYGEERSDLTHKAEFERRTEEAIRQGRKWLKGHPHDAEAMVCVGAMYGLRAYLGLTLRKWVKAYFDARQGLKYLRRAVKEQPEVYEAYTGLGMFEYYADTLRGVLRVAVNILIRANSGRGIEHLKLSAAKSRHSQTVSKLILVDIYSQYKGKHADPAQALKLIREVRGEYPANPLFHYVEIISLYESGNLEDADRETQEYLGRIRDGSPYYHKTYEPRGYVALGTVRMARGDWEGARKAFEAGQADLSMERPARWAVWCLVRLAQVKDILGEREEALKDYRRALEYPDLWGLRETIEPYLKASPQKSALPGQLPPP